MFHLKYFQNYHCFQHTATMGSGYHMISLLFYPLLCFMVGFQDGYLWVLFMSFICEIDYISSTLFVPTNDIIYLIWHDLTREHKLNLRWFVYNATSNRDADIVKTLLLCRFPHYVMQMHTSFKTNTPDLPKTPPWSYSLNRGSIWSSDWCAVTRWLYNVFSLVTVARTSARLVRSDKTHMLR